MIIVSRESKADSRGQKLCSCGCGKPRDRKGQNYRRECHARYMRNWRAGKVTALLTPEEWARILSFRALGGEGGGAIDPRGRGLSR